VIGGQWFCDDSSTALSLKWCVTTVWGCLKFSKTCDVIFRQPPPYRVEMKIRWNTLTSVVVADFVGLAILTGLTTLDAHSINTDPLRAALLAAAANGLANTLDKFNKDLLRYICIWILLILLDQRCPSVFFCSPQMWRINMAICHIWEYS